MTDVMIDIETLGTKSYAAIISIAALEFDISTGTAGHYVQMNVDAQSSVDAGLRIEAETVFWWLKQDTKAITALLTEKPVSLHRALVELKEFIEDRQTIAGLRFWGNSARFDLGLLDNAYERAGIKTPWSPFQEMDLRTLDRLMPWCRKSQKFEGVKHNSLDDCLNQVAWASKIWQHINPHCHA